MVTPSGQTVSYSYGAPSGTQPGKLVQIQVNGVDVIKCIVYEPFGPNGGWSWGNHNGTSVINQHLRVFDRDYRSTAISSDPPTLAQLHLVKWRGFRSAAAPCRRFTGTPK